LFIGYAEAINDELVSVVQKREVEAFVDSAKEDNKPKYFTGLENTCWLTGLFHHHYLVLRLPLTFVISFLNLDHLQ
jgi:hypothetical protein